MTTSFEEPDPLTNSAHSSIDTSSETLPTSGRQRRIDDAYPSGHAAAFQEPLPALLRGKGRVDISTDGRGTMPTYGAFGACARGELNLEAVSDSAS
ncbi:hypothetical protein ACPMJQ_31885 [Streptomyces pseudogriseolus]|uniref:hypothetical protein n=1 Tax=Streptomyces pseudogriseolus TaxID=36817 RepID=UPI003FA1AD83|nr:hypothetical protein [Streptomyces pseudogriseolus]